MYKTNGNYKLICIAEYTEIMYHCYVPKNMVILTQAKFAIFSYLELIDTYYVLWLCNTFGILCLLLIVDNV